MRKVDFELTGKDAAEVAHLLKIPLLEDGVWGWRAALEPTAFLRRIRVQELQSDLGYGCKVTVRPHRG